MSWVTAEAHSVTSIFGYYFYGTIFRREPQIVPKIAFVTERIFYVRVLEKPPFWRAGSVSGCNHSRRVFCSRVLC
jgi:hypothetical protein